MSESKVLMFIIGTILLLGILFTSVASSFSDTEDLNDTWVTDVGLDKMGGAIIDIGKYTVSSATWIYDAVGSIFGVGEKRIITINGTGEQSIGFLGNLSLDGDYEFQENYNPAGVDEVYENSIRTSIISSEVAQIRVNYSSENDTIPEKAWLISDSYGRDYEDRIYEPTDINKLGWYTEWDLYDNNRSLTWNDKAYGEGDQLEDIPTSTTEKVRDFFDRVKEDTQNAIKTFGLIPEVIGIPIIIVFLVGIIYIIIKALPWT